MEFPQKKRIYHKRRQDQKMNEDQTPFKLSLMDELEVKQQDQNGKPDFKI